MVRREDNREELPLCDLRFQLFWRIQEGDSPERYGERRVTVEIRRFGEIMRARSHVYGFDSVGGSTHCVVYRLADLVTSLRDRVKIHSIPGIQLFNATNRVSVLSKQSPFDITMLIVLFDKRLSMQL